MTQAPPQSPSGPSFDEERDTDERDIEERQIGERKIGDAEAGDRKDGEPAAEAPRTARRGALTRPDAFTPRHDDRERSLPQKLLLATSSLLAVVILVVSAGGYALYHYFDGQIGRIKIAIGGDRPADAAPGTENFLLVGSDSRAGTGNEFQSAGEVAGERSDTTMLAHLDADGSTTLVSFPRDTLVRIPGHGRDKLNAAVTLGGPTLLVQTIENLTDIKIDHYVSIDLAGFRDMTDAIGGVTVCLKPLPDGSDSNLHDVNSQWRGQVGENHLDGESALAFVRQRMGLPAGDFDRIRRQQQFVSAVLQQATSTGVLANPARLEALLSAATGALTVDEGTSIADLRTLAGRLRGMAADQVSFETIPVRSPTAEEGANSRGELDPWGSVQIFDQKELDAFFEPLRGHERSGHTPDDNTTATELPGAAATDPTDPVDPSTIRVDIYNAAGVPGLAAQVSSQLAAAGFEVGTAENWPSGRRTTTQVRYDPKLAAEAETLAARIPGAELVEDADLGSSVSLVLGSDFDGVATGVPAGATAGVPQTDGGTATNGGTAGPSPTVSPMPTAVTAAELVAGCTY